MSSPASRDVRGAEKHLFIGRHIGDEFGWAAEGDKLAAIGLVHLADFVTGRVFGVGKMVVLTHAERVVDGEDEWCAAVAG